MSTTVFILMLLGIVFAVYAGLAIHAYVRMRGQRVVVCPETDEPAGVKVDAMRAAISAVWEMPEVRLVSCTRWPGRAGCNQACAGQIAVDPKGTLATRMLKNWYAGRTCSVCRRPIGRVTGGEPRPGLLNLASPSHEILSWDDVPPDQLSAALATHLPVCANCPGDESFRRQFPDVVTDRAVTDQRDLVVH